MPGPFGFHEGREHLRQAFGPAAHLHAHARGGHNGPFGFGPWQGGPWQGGPPGFGPGFGPWQGHGRGHGRGKGRGRQRRGDVRAAVLALLTERPMHGYEMIREISDRSGGAWRPSPGSVYPLLQQLADEDLVTEAEQSQGGKKLFTLTEQGSAEAQQHTADPPWEQAAADVPPEDGSLQAAIGQLGGAAMQLALVGTPGQKSRASRILNDARKELYSMLSEDDDTGEPDAGENATDEE